MEATTQKMEKLSEMLKIFGLSNYEAQGYSALLYHGIASAENIADTAKIPRTSAYKVMESLVEKGYAKETEGRPKMYKPASPEDVKSIFERIVTETYQIMKEVQESRNSNGDPQLIYTIYGHSRVLAKISEVINGTEKELFICTPMIKELRESLKKELENAKRRGVNIVIITPPNKRAPENVKVLRKEGLIATDIVSDKTRAILTDPDLNACGYTDNPTLALHVYQFVQMIIENSEIHSSGDIN
ncbi:TrmB family transcriptional regulator [Caldiplasma sukawensis]